MNSSYQKFSNNDTEQVSKDIKLIDNLDNTFSISVLNIPQGIQPSAKSYVINKSEIPILGGNVVTPLITIKNNNPDGIIRFGTVSIATEGNKPVIFEIYRNATLANSTFVNFGNGSFSSYDISATSLSGGIIVGGVVLNKVDSARINLFTNDIFIKANYNETLTLACKTSNPSEVTFFVRHLENEN